MNLNASKGKYFKITLKRNFINSSYWINGTTLENVNSLRDLGAIIDQNLDSSDHVSSMVSKAKRALGLLIRTFQSASPRCRLDKQAALAAYNANVRSILEIIWGGAAKCHLARKSRGEGAAPVFDVAGTLNGLRRFVCRILWPAGITRGVAFGSSPCAVWCSVFMQSFEGLHLLIFTWVFWAACSNQVV